MKVNVIRGLFYILMMLYISSCNVENHSSDSNDQQQDINQTITISAPPQVNQLKINDSVGLLIQNHSEDKIELSYAYGVNIKKQMENQWFDVLTVMDAYLSPTVLSSQSQKDFRFTYIEFIPKLQAEAPTTFRFTVRGIKQSTKHEVYAFVDLKLSP